MYNDDEATEFEMNPLGARQRMLPSRTFLSRIPTPVPAPLQAPPMAAAPAQPLLLLPPEIHYPDAVDEIISGSMSALPASSSSVGMAAALPIASRRFRWLAVPLVSLLALVVLGGAMWQPNELQAPSIAADITATDEEVAPGADQMTANEDPAPDEVIEAKPAKRVARAVVVAKPAKQSRKITVNTSSALGNLRPKKAW